MQCQDQIFVKVGLGHSFYCEKLKRDETACKSQNKSSPIKTLQKIIYIYDITIGSFRFWFKTTWTDVCSACVWFAVWNIQNSWNKNQMHRDIAELCPEHVLAVTARKVVTSQHGEIVHKHCFLWYWRLIKLDICYWWNGNVKIVVF